MGCNALACCTEALPDSTLNLLPVPSDQTCVLAAFEMNCVVEPSPTANTVNRSNQLLHGLCSAESDAFEQYADGCS